MAKLNQIIAIEKGIKARAHGVATELYKAAQKSELFYGFNKTYRKRDEDGEELPAERKRVQMQATEALQHFERGLTELMEVTARKDWTNCIARADVKIDDAVILKDVPVTYLLFLEKQLTDMRTFVASLPVLDDGENWTKDPNSGLYKTEPTQTHRTKKVQKGIVLYPATDNHPAQTQMVTEDVISGFWSQEKHSGAMPRPEKVELGERIEKLLRAVKEAREQSNMTDEVRPPDVAGAVFGFLLWTTGGETSSSLS